MQNCNQFAFKTNNKKQALVIAMIVFLRHKL